ncbi:Ig-like domain-containing protein [Deinococcus sp.]|uniref:Ig-like domain-containing protein n=1 Tax=Deinococcus sp. TaxID=47478 RepID=UPI003C7A188D
MNKRILLVPLLLAACQQTSSTPPSVSITSPAVGQPVSGTAQVQVSATSGNGVVKVTLYARSRGSSGPGLVVGSATTEPFVVSW